jgi:acylphosphatase
VPVEPGCAGAGGTFGETGDNPAVPGPARDAIRRRVIISGRVQGVWFRAACSEEANRLGVSGTVQNRPDGTVEGDFEGEPAAVLALIEWCHHGPSEAVVADVAVVEARPIGYGDFRVV